MASTKAPWPKRILRLILRINAGARENGLSYSKLMFGLAQAGVALNRKVLADLAVRQKEDFAKLVELAKTKLA